MALGHTSYDAYVRYYANQAGGGSAGVGSGYIRGFRAPQYQRGYGFGSIFQSLIRFLTPLIQSSGFRRVAGTAGKHLIRTAADIGGDIVRGKNVGESIKERVANTLENIGRDQSGSGRKRKLNKILLAGDTGTALAVVPAKRRRRRAVKRKSTASGKTNKSKRRKTVTKRRRTATVKRKSPRATTVVKRRRKTAAKTKRAAAPSRRKKSVTSRRKKRKSTKQPSFLKFL